MMRILTTISAFILPFLALAQVVLTDKVDSYLQEKLYDNPESYYEVYILLEEQLDIEQLKQDLLAKNKTTDEIYIQISKAAYNLAQETQPALLARLTALEGWEEESLVPLWIANVIQVRAKASAIASISKWREVQRIEQVPENILFDGEDEGELLPPSPNDAEQGLEAINAHKMWRLGYTGYGTKVLVADSGNELSHPALFPNYWGHNVPGEYAWTGEKGPEACNDHGTLVTGIITGLDRTTNDTTGVAPNARWMGGPIDFGSCNLLQNIPNTGQVFQWAINPDDNFETLDDRPDVINNSWGNNSATCDRTYNAMMQLLEGVGIAVVWAAGNSGLDGPMSVYGAQNINATLVNTFTVGNLDGRTLQISDDSSRGPSYCGLSGGLAIKPEVSAPGQNVRSTNQAGEYQGAFGTSFSSPHVAGALLLLREAFPEVSSENLKLALYYSARDLGTPGEDNTYGTGIIDVFAAYEYLIAEGNTPTPPVSATNDVVLVDVHTERDVSCLGAVDVDISFENNGTSTLNALDIEYVLNGEESSMQRISWTGAVQKDRVANFDLVTLSDLPPGEHELTVRISNPNGQTDTRALNNVIKQQIHVVDLEYIDVRLSAEYQEEVCNNARVVLQTETPLTNEQTILWYDRPAGSVLLNAGKLGEGNPFLSEPLEEPTTFYADILTTTRVGKENTEADAASSAAEIGIRFNVERPMILKSVKVYADGDGARFIKILDENDNTVLTKTTILDDGINVVPLNKSLERGSGYSIVLSSPSKPLRISSSADFPYEIPGVLSLTSSVGSQLRYFFFFDWEVQTLHACGRTSINVDVASNSNAPNVGITVSAEQVALDAATVEFNSISGSAFSTHWDFGDGTQSTDRNPTHTYTSAGDFVVTHTVTDGAGCSNAVQKTITVDSDDNTTSVEELLDENAVSVFPNPTTDQVVLQTRRAQKMEVQVTDLLGRIMPVKVSRLNSTGLMLNTQILPDGVYYILIDIDGQQLTKKLVKAS